MRKTVIAFFCILHLATLLYVQFVPLYDDEYAELVAPGAKGSAQAFTRLSQRAREAGSEFPLSVLASYQSFTATGCPLMFFAYGGLSSYMQFSVEADTASPPVFQTCGIPWGECFQGVYQPATIDFMLVENLIGHFRDTGENSPLMHLARYGYRMKPSDAKTVSVVLYEWPIDPHFSPIAFGAKPSRRTVALTYPK